MSSTEHKESGKKSIYLRGAPWEQSFAAILTPMEEFLHRQTTSGIVLMLAAIAALVLANSPLSEDYFHLLHVYTGLAWAEAGLKMSLHHWINDGLMAFFFFLVGLEIKREVLVGELASVRAATVPVLAAIGGMVVPALIYAGINYGGEGAAGWGIPMATDIAFAVGVLALLGDRIPRTLITFLLALAIVDDLGAVAVIALFYTESINVTALAWCGGIVLLLIACNMAGVRKPLPYALLGLLLWLAMLASGIHATVAGVLTAFAIPCKPKVNAQHFSDKVRGLMKRFDENCTGRRTLIHNDQQRAIVQSLEEGTLNVQSPLQRMEHSLHPTVAYLIIPVFALANAGVALSSEAIQAAGNSPVSLGIAAGLLIGKPVGIVLASLIAVRLGLGTLPKACSKRHLLGAGLLAGIGFTMAIFIAELGFRGSAEMLATAKMGILVASLVAGVAGYLVLLTGRHIPDEENQEASLVTEAEVTT